MSDRIIRGVVLQAQPPILPKVIVPVMANQPEAAVALAAQTTEADLVELRMDALPVNAYLDTLCAVRKAVGGKPLLVTIRTRREGGLAEMSVSEYVEACRALLATRTVDILDIEWTAGVRAVDELREAAHEAGALALFSCHHFEGTPSRDEMAGVLVDMAQRGADIAKLAVMPRSAADAALLLQATALAKAECPETPLLTMSMGALGAVTRICGGAFGSCATFGAAGGRTSAPGQPDAAALRTALDALRHALQG